MKGKIDKSGNLLINRAGTFKQAYCPHEGDSESAIKCTDNCALFYEDSYKTGKYVKLCNGSTIEIVGDER